MNKQYLSGLLFVLSSQVQAYPNFFCRLIREENGQIERVVDIIGDYHVNIEHRVRRASKGIPEYLLKSDERKIFTTAERTLLKTLRYLAKKSNEPITLLWEWTDENYEALPSTNFIMHIGSILRKEFAENLHKKIVFVPADTYRFDHIKNRIVFYPDLGDETSLNQTIIGDVFASLNDPLPANQLSRHLVDNDLQKIQNSTIKTKLMQSWNDYLDKSIKPIYYTYIEPYKTMNIKNFVQLSQFQTFADRFFDEIIPEMPNYELLFKLFGSANRHVIVYAGANHCDEVMGILQDEYGFTPVVDCGIGDDSNSTNADIESTTPIESYTATLLPNVWKFLTESYQERFTIYKKNGIYRHLLSHDDIKIFFDAIGQNNTKNMLTILKKAHAACVDLINAQDKSGTTPLQVAVLFGKIDMVKFLLDHGAYPNIFNDTGETPLHKAIVFGNNELAALLLSRGANPFQHNNSEKSPLDLANMSKDEIIKKLLNSYAKKWMSKKGSA